MRSILIDAGPVIALFDRSDRYHRGAVEFLGHTSCRLVTTWPAVTEASHMLDFDRDAQISLLEWMRRGGLVPFDLTLENVRCMIHLMKKYDNVPMELADASLVAAAEATGIREIMSIDSDFDVYRTSQNETIENVFGPNRSR